MHLVLSQSTLDWVVRHAFTIYEIILIPYCSIDRLYVIHLNGFENLCGPSVKMLDSNGF